MAKLLDSLDLQTRNQVIGEVKEMIKQQETEQDMKLKGVSDEVKDFVKSKGETALKGKEL